MKCNNPLCRIKLCATFFKTARLNEIPVKYSIIYGVYPSNPHKSKMFNKSFIFIH